MPETCLAGSSVEGDKPRGKEISEKIIVTQMKVGSDTGIQKTI